MKKRTIKTAKKEDITSTPTATLNTRTIIRTGYQTLQDILSMRDTGHGQKFINGLSEELLSWGKKETSTDMLDFHHSFGIPRSSFHVYLKKYPDLKYVYHLVLEMLGSRRQKLAMYKELGCDAKVILSTLRLYHPDWEQVTQEELSIKRELRQEEESKLTHVTVVMPKYEVEDRNSD